MAYGNEMMGTRRCKKTHLINYFKSYEYKFFPLKFFHSFHCKISAPGSRSVFSYNALGVLPQHSHTANRFAHSFKVYIHMYTFKDWMIPEGECIKWKLWGIERKDMTVFSSESPNKKNIETDKFFEWISFILQSKFLCYPSRELSLHSNM